MNFDNSAFATRPQVAFFSKDSSLGVYLLENLLSHYLQIIVFSKNLIGWEAKTKHIGHNRFFTLRTRGIANSDKFSYFVLDFNEIKNLQSQELETIYTNALRNGAKILLIAPFVTADQGAKQDLNRIKNFFANYELFKTVYVGETFGPRAEGEESFVSEVLVRSIVEKKIISFKKDFNLYPAYSPYLAKKLTRELFSFGTKDLEIAFFSNPISFSSFAKIVRELLVNSGESRGTDTERVVQILKKRFVIETNFKNAIKETLEWFIKYPPRALPRREKTRPVEVKENKVKLAHKINPKKVISILFLTVALVILLPSILLGGSLLSLGVGANSLKNGNLKNAKLFFALSESLSFFSERQFGLVEGIPVVGKPFLYQQRINSLIKASAYSGYQTIDILSSVSGVLSKIVKKEDYDLDQFASTTALKLDTLYKDLSFLEGDLSPQGFYGGILQKYLEDGKLSETRHKILASKNLFSELPDLLGKNSPKTYLVLFQNNMELRPTGGFIGSFALITFNRGILSSIEVRDVYEADGQLKGHVEPPEPIKKYLGEGGWFLRDANWDTDFPTSASKIEWFLGKEIDKVVDGVIAVDLNLVSSLLEETGPIYLADFNKEITSANLYQETQSQVESDFFPGSQSKRNFLTALSRNLISKITELPPDKYLKVAKVLFANLEEKHIQIFLHNRKAQTGISEAGYDGSVTVPSCKVENCYTDLVGVVEANLGVNKQNYFVRRSMNLEIMLGENLMRSLNILFENLDTSQTLNNSYKPYVRVLIPNDAELEGVWDEGQEVATDIVETNGRKEVGFFIEVPNSSQKNINIKWESTRPLDLGGPGSYQLLWRKQPGTDIDSTALSFAADNPLVFEGIEPSLTTQGIYVYNTVLARDLFSRVSW